LYGGEVPVDQQVEQPVEQERDTVFGQLVFVVQRWTSASTSKRSSLRTVINAAGVMNAASSLVLSLPVGASSSAA